METILTFLLQHPDITGFLLAFILIGAASVRWNLVFYTFIWVLFVMIMFCWYWADRVWSKFKKWMQKPEPWYDNFNAWFLHIKK